MSAEATDTDFDKGDTQIPEENETPAHDDEEATEEQEDEEDEDPVNQEESSVISLPVPSASDCQYTPCYCEVSQDVSSLPR